MDQENIDFIVSRFLRISGFRTKRQLELHQTSFPCSKNTGKAVWAQDYICSGFLSACGSLISFLAICLAVTLASNSPVAYSLFENFAF